MGQRACTKLSICYWFVKRLADWQAIAAIASRDVAAEDCFSRYVSSGYESAIMIVVAVNRVWSLATYWLAASWLTTDNRTSRDRPTVRKQRMTDTLPLPSFVIPSSPRCSTAKPLVSSAALFRRVVSNKRAMTVVIATKTPNNNDDVNCLSDWWWLVDLVHRVGIFTWSYHLLRNNGIIGLTGRRNEWRVDRPADQKPTATTMTKMKRRSMRTLPALCVRAYTSLCACLSVCMWPSSSLSVNVRATVNQLQVHEFLRSYWLKIATGRMKITISYDFLKEPI